MFIAVVNQKGGVGKTTLAVHLALWLKERGRSVALIDTDEQQSAGRWIREADSGVTVIQEHDADALIERTPGLVATHDCVVADGPANLAECTRAVLLVTDVAVVPCGPTVPELESTAATIRMLRNANSVRGGDVPRPILVLTRMRPRRYRLSQEAMEAVPMFDIPIAHHVVPAREAIADAPGQRTAVWHMGRHAAQAANEFISLLEEIEAYAWKPTNGTHDTQRSGAVVSQARACA